MPRIENNKIMRSVEMLDRHYLQKIAPEADAEMGTRILIRLPIECMYHSAMRLLVAEQD